MARALMPRQPYSVAVLSTEGRLHPSFQRREGLVRMWSSLWLKGDGGIRKMPSLMVKKDGLILENNTIMADKEFLERMLSMLPEEFQDIYDDTIPEAKEIRKKMRKKVSSVKSYSCAMLMFEDIRKLNYKGQAQVCKAFHQYLKKHPNVVSFFLDRFEETYSRINMRDLEESIEWIGYAVNDMDNTISEIDYNDPMTFFDIEKVMGKVISKELKSNSLK